MNNYKNKNKLSLAFKPNSNLFLWKVNAYPALNWPPLVAFFKDKRYGWPDSEILFLDRNIYWWSNWDAVLERGVACVKHFVGNHDDFSKAYYEKYKAVSNKLEGQFRILDAVDWKKINKKTLSKLWADFFNVYENIFWSTVIYPEIVAYGASLMLANEIKRRKIIMKPKDLSCLATFTKLSYAAEEEKYLLQIFLEKDVRIKQKKLREHAQNFRWLLNGYHGVTPIGLDYFEKRLDDIKFSAAAKKHLSRLERYSVQAEKDFFKVIKKYNLSKNLIRLARITQRGSFLQDDRKRLNLIADEYVVKLYSALARQLKISLKDSLYILNNEFDAAFKKKKMSKLIKARRNSWRIKAVAPKISCYFSGAREVQKLLEEYRLEVLGEKINGSVAYPGKVKGIVKIINNVGGIKKFSKGEVLVTVMTSPDYISAMKDSIAIITDEGGLTCHAAIIARELKKPCIIRTKIATKVLHDGDLIEVDANKGVVKIIKRK